MHSFNKCCCRSNLPLKRRCNRWINCHGIWRIFIWAVLVACQVYAVGTISDINEIEKSKHNKIALYKYKETDFSEYTYVELINALANFFKHNEEWSTWPINETTKTLRYYKIDENTEFPLHTGIIIIIGESSDLRQLCTVLEDWRFSLLNIWNKNPQ